MTTYKYSEIRRDIFENCSNKSLKKYRSFSDMKRLFKKSYWTILILLIICLISYIITFLICPKNFYWLIPVILTFILGIIFEFFGAKMYNIPERKKELQKQNDCLETYTQNIKDVLYSHGIKTKSQIDILRKECEATLSRHDKKYSVVNNKVFDMLVGVPLGALISSLIYKSKNDDTIIAAILTLVILGGMFILLSSIIKKLTYYSDGYFKDQYLLNALNELEYCILPDENT